ncbi:MAG: DinB family protein, partial [Bacteriovoracaceae bacterium]|nr:DinB family protein [Bacteriovoracaceae bacterium]
MEHRYREIRNKTTSLCSPLEIEDMLVQSCPDVSPPKWHLAHTTWFFEKFVLQENLPSYRVFNEKFNYLFNSYYKTVGNHWNRLDRSKLSRPTVKEVREYREYVDECMIEYFNGQISPATQSVIEIGLQHEQQHQELLLMDIKHILSLNPISAVYEKTCTHESINHVPENRWYMIKG